MRRIEEKDRKEKITRIDYLAKFISVVFRRDVQQAIAVAGHHPCVFTILVLITLIQTLVIMLW